MSTTGQEGRYKGGGGGGEKFNQRSQEAHPTRCRLGPAWVSSPIREEDKPRPQSKKKEEGGDHHQATSPPVEEEVGRCAGRVLVVTEIADIGGAAPAAFPPPGTDSALVLGWGTASARGGARSPLDPDRSDPLERTGSIGVR